MSEAGERLIQSAKEAAQMAKEHARQTQDEELVEQVELASDDVDAGLSSDQALYILAAIEPLITHKAKEEGKAELLKQMMKWAVYYDKGHGTDHASEFLRAAATEQGVNIEKGER